MMLILCVWGVRELRILFLDSACSCPIRFQCSVCCSHSVRTLTLLMVTSSWRLDNGAS